jgi:hypothetical protein
MAAAMFGSAVIPATPPTIEARPAKESLREMESTFIGCWLVPKALTAGTRVSAAMMEREDFIVYFRQFGKILAGVLCLESKVELEFYCQLLVGGGGTLIDDCKQL